jgi:hypothetical protein
MTARPVKASSPTSCETAQLIGRVEINIPEPLFRQFHDRLPRRVRDAYTQARRGADSSSIIPPTRVADGVVRISTRAATHIAEILRRSGVEVASLVAGWPTPISSALLGATTRFHRHFYETHWSGQFVAQDERGAFKIAIDLARLEGRQILFVAFSHDEAVRLCIALRRELEERVELIETLAHRPTARLLVAGRVACKNIAFDCPMTVFVRWRPNWLRRMIGPILNPSSERVFVIRSQDIRLSEADVDGLEAFVGPVIANFGRKPARLTYSTVPFGGAGSRSRRRQGDYDAQSGIVQHDRRNQALAALARELDGARRATDRICLVARNLEHATTLTAVLPGWDLIHKASPVLSWPFRCVVTLAAIERLAAQGRLQADDILWGAGGGKSGWVHRLLTHTTVRERPLRIVDLTDEFTHRAWREAQERTDAYKLAGGHYRPLPKALLRGVWKAIKHHRR